MATEHLVRMVVVVMTYLRDGDHVLVDRGCVVQVEALDCLQGAQIDSLPIHGLCGGGVGCTSESRDRVQ